MKNKPVCLIIDDDPQLRGALVDCLDLHHIDSIEAKTTTEAQEILKTQKPDFLILDMIISGGPSGYRFLQSYTYNIPVIVFSGDINEWNAIKMPNVNHFIQKPVHPDILMKVIREVLTQKSTPANNSE